MEIWEKGWQTLLWETILSWHIILCNLKIVSLRKSILGDFSSEALTSLQVFPSSFTGSLSLVEFRIPGLGNTHAFLSMGSFQLAYKCTVTSTILKNKTFAWIISLLPLSAKAQEGCFHSSYPISFFQFLLKVISIRLSLPSTVPILPSCPSIFCSQPKEREWFFKNAMPLFKHCNCSSLKIKAKVLSCVVCVCVCIKDYTWSDLPLHVFDFLPPSTLLVHSTPGTLVYLIFLAYSRLKAFCTAFTLPGTLSLQISMQHIP